MNFRIGIENGFLLYQKYLDKVEDTGKKYMNTMLT